MQQQVHIWRNVYASIYMQINKHITCPSGDMARYNTLRLWPVRVATCVSSSLSSVGKYDGKMPVLLII